MQIHFLANIKLAMPAQFRGLDPANPSAWALLPRLILLLVFCSLAGGFWWLYSLRDCADELQKLRDRENILRLEFSDKLRKAAMLTMLKQQREEIALTVQDLEEQLPNRTGMPSLLLSISQIVRKHNLQQELFRPNVVVFKKYYTIVPVTIRANGGYHDFGRFAADIANLPRIVNLSNMSITSKPEGGLTLEATVLTYRHLSPGEVSAQLKGSELVK